MRAFSSNSFVNTMDMTAAIEYIFTAAQSLVPHSFFVIFCFFQPDSCVSLQAMLKSMPAHIGHCGPKPG